MRIADVARLFCDGRVANSQNLNSTGSELFSYRAKIAWWEDGKIYLNTHKYSQTTSRHQNLVRRYAPKNLLVEVD